MGNRNINTKKDKKVKKDVKKNVRAEPLNPVAVDVVRKKRKEVVAE